MGTTNWTGRARTSLRTLRDRVAGSLFFVPLAFVLAGMALAAATVGLDRGTLAGDDLPLVLEPTVDSSRAVLTTIAAATMTVAGIAFSVALLVMQLASSQHSPRVTHSLFRDPFNSRAMGVALGTFSYCLLALQNVRSLDGGDADVVLPLTTTLAIALGIAALLTIVAFIDHSAHMMDVSRILADITAQTCSGVQREWVASPEPDPSVGPPQGDGLVVRSDRHGWVQHVDTAAMLSQHPHGVVHVHRAAGSFVVTGSPICSLWPAPDPSDADRVERSLRSSFRVGEDRTMIQDVTFGVRQLVDVALRALSPGVNDPTTAVDSVHHLVAVLVTMSGPGAPPSTVTSDEGGRVVLPPWSMARVVALAFDEIRVAASDHPRVLVQLVQALDELRRASDGDPSVHTAVRQQVSHVVQGLDGTAMIDADRARVRDAAAHVLL